MNDSTGTIVHNWKLSSFSRSHLQDQWNTQTSWTNKTKMQKGGCFLLISENHCTLQHLRWHFYHGVCISLAGLQLTHNPSHPFFICKPFLRPVSLTAWSRASGKAIIPQANRRQMCPSLSLSLCVSLSLLISQSDTYTLTHTWALSPHTPLSKDLIRPGFSSLCGSIFLYQSRCRNEPLWKEDLYGGIWRAAVCQEENWHWFCTCWGPLGMLGWTEQVIRVNKLLCWLKFIWVWFWDPHRKLKQEVHKLCAGVCPNQQTTKTASTCLSCICTKLIKG